MPTYLNILTTLGQFKMQEYIFSQFQNQKLARNSVALTHALIAVVQNYMHISVPIPKLYNMCKSWSSGYFLWDMLYIFQHEKLDILRIAYIYHHIATIYIINKPPSLYFGDQILFWGEFSNIPSYFVYYYLHTKPNSKELKSWLILQKMLYALIRIPIFGYLLLTAWRTMPNKLPLTIISPVYLMGLIWTYILCNK